MGYRKYTAEFKREVLTLAAEGRRSVAQLERELDITPGLMYKWQQRYRVQADSCSRVRNAPNRLSCDGYGGS
jgi:Transposase.